MRGRWRCRLAGRRSATAQWRQGTGMEGTVLLSGRDGGRTRAVGSQPPQYAGRVNTHSLVVLALQASLLALLAGGISDTSCMNNSQRKFPGWSEETTTTKHSGCTGQASVRVPAYCAHVIARSFQADAGCRGARQPQGPLAQPWMALTCGEQGDQGRQEDEGPHSGSLNVRPIWERA